MVWSERNLFPFCAWMDSDFNSKGFSRQEKVARTWAPRLAVCAIWALQPKVSEGGFRDRRRERSRYGRSGLVVLV